MKTIKNLITVDDIGLDTDDCLNARLRAKLILAGELEVTASIACMYPAYDRADLMTKVYNLEGVDVDVAVGSDFNEKKDPEHYEFDLPIEWGQEVSDWGSQVVSMRSIYRDLERANDKSITLQICAGLGDVWRMIVKSPYLVASRIKEVYIMGGASWEGDYMIADPTASNNKFSQNEIDCQHVYDWFIDHKIPVKVLSRHTAYAVDLPRDLYRSLDGSVGEYLQRVYRGSMQKFWVYYNSNPIEHRQNRYAFARNFCGLDDLPIAADGDPWEYIKGVKAYDPLTTLYAVYPELFLPSKRTIRGVECEIVGLSKEETGMKDPIAVADKLMQLIK